MPYFIGNPMSVAGMAGFRYDPEYGFPEERPFAMGWDVTQDQRDEFPRKVRLLPVDESFPPPGIMGRLTGPWVVCEKLKDQLERLEPGANEFLPLEAVNNKDDRPLGTYYYIYMRQKIDAFDYEETLFHEGKGMEAAKRSMFSPQRLLEGDFEITLRQSAIEGKHLWRGTDDTRSTAFFCSDEVADFVKREQLIGWELHPCRVSRDAPCARRTH